MKDDELIFVIAVVEGIEYSMHFPVPSEQLELTAKLRVVQIKVMFDLALAALQVQSTVEPFLLAQQLELARFVVRRRLSLTATCVEELTCVVEPLLQLRLVLHLLEVLVNSAAVSFVVDRVLNTPTPAAVLAARTTLTEAVTRDPLMQIMRDIQSMIQPVDLPTQYQSLLTLLT